MTEILIVDDELGIRNILSEILVDSNYRVATAANATEARDLVASRQFDLVLLDIWMPDTDGLTLLREWKYAGQLNFPVIVMSGHGSIEHAKRALEDGAVDFIEKPISLKRLLSAIPDGISRWETARREQAASEELDGRRTRRTKRTASQRQRLPSFEIPEYGLTLDFNRPFRDVLFEFERAYFRTVLMHLDQSMADLSRHAGMERTHLYRKVRALGLDVEALREEARRNPQSVPASTTETEPTRIAASTVTSSGSTLDFPTGSTLDVIPPYK
ncbi:response regulator [Sutterella sp.]|uniref:response regulator n=1 Tax=Sutterella sp. TaxID=1981025 RepID=UPI0026E0BC7E|nr:response regulator [Sutterella sp.]MDO5530396.1 response regulator [Sutterella sp.]